MDQQQKQPAGQPSKSNGLTAVRKRQQIQTANKTMFLWIAGAAVALAMAVVGGQLLVRESLFNGKIISEKGKTLETLDDNIAAVEGLKTEVNKLTANSDLSRLKTADNDTALQVIIDALPTADDRTALGASLQQVILARSGVTIDSISVTESGVQEEVITGDASTPSEITFSFTIIGDYDRIRSALRDIERSIRPINIENIEVQGTAQSLQATISAKTYYLPPKTVQLGSKEVQP